MQNHKSIEQLWILEHCSSHTRQQFAKLGRITAYPKNHHCLRAREKNANIFFILSGKVHIYTLTKNGSKKVLFILGKNHIANGNLTDHYNTTFCETMEPCQGAAPLSGAEAVAAGAPAEKHGWQHLPGTEAGRQAVEAGQGFRHPDREGHPDRHRLKHHLSGRPFGRPQGKCLKSLQKADGLPADHNRKEKDLYPGCRKDGCFL